MTIEGVAAGEPVQVAGVDVGARRPSSATAPPTAAASPIRRVDRWRGQLPDGDPQRVVGGQALVAVGDQDQGARMPDPPAQEAQQVEGRLVGPVHVLDDEDRRASGARQLASRAENSCSRGAVCRDSCSSVAAELAGEVEQAARAGAA